MRYLANLKFRCHYRTNLHIFPLSPASLHFAMVLYLLNQRLSCKTCLGSTRTYLVIRSVFKKNSQTPRTETTSSAVSATAASSNSSSQSRRIRISRYSNVTSLQVPVRQDQGTRANCDRDCSHALFVPARPSVRVIGKQQSSCALLIRAWNGIRCCT